MFTSMGVVAYESSLQRESSFTTTMKLLLWVCTWLCVTCSSAQNCTEQSLVANLGSRDQETNSGLVSLALDTGQGTESNVRILNQNIVCLATDTTRGQYRQASVVVEYTLNTAQGLSQIEFSCMSGAWSERVGQSSSRVQTPPNATLTTPTRRDCEFCLDPMDATHCSACSLSCVGLRECTSDTDCCNYDEDNMCVANCSAGRTLNTDNFTCDLTTTPPTTPLATTTPPTTPSATTNPPTTPLMTTTPGLGGGAIAGIVIAVIAVVVVITVITVIIIVVVLTRKKKPNDNQPLNETQLSNQEKASESNTSKDAEG